MQNPIFNRIIGATLVLGAIFGTAFFYNSTQPPNSSAQTAQTPTENKSGFNYGRAKLENERNTVEIADKTTSGVVFITAQTQVDPQQPDPFQEYFGFQGQSQPQKGTGSGFVIDKTGLILTNNHVVTLDSDQVGDLTVKFHNDSTQYKAKVVGRSPVFDIALIKVDAPANKLVPINFGDSDLVKVGQKAIAVGNPFGQESTVTEGIISAIGRQLEDLGNLSTNVLQTDAAVNPGNSGGPLLNSDGEVVGINTSILSPNGQQFAGIAYAVPINTAKKILPELKAGKILDTETLAASSPRLGVVTSPISMSQLSERFRQQNGLPAEGIMIDKVEAKSPAEKAGLRGATQRVPSSRNVQIPVDGDVITSINGISIDTSAKLQSIIFNKKAGDEVTLTIYRAGKQMTVKVKLEIIKK